MIKFINTYISNLFQHPSSSSKPISNLGVFVLVALLSGLDREQRYINL